MKNWLKAIIEYDKNYGLGRIAPFIIFYGLGLFLMSGTIYLKWEPICFIPVIVSLLTLSQNEKIVEKGWFLIYFMNVINIITFIVVNYYIVGEFDRNIGGLPRWDQFFVDFDNRAYGMPAANLFLKWFNPSHFFGKIFYDLISFAYLFYFVMPVFAGASMFYLLPEEERFRIGRYFSSILCFYAINYLFYLIVPVTGPQYFIPEQFSPLELDAFGRFAVRLVSEGQPTFIDCFPSGHVGITSLVTFWLFKTKSPFRYFGVVDTLLVISATLALRYHYTLDLIAAIPLAMTAHSVGWFLFPTELDVTHMRKVKDATS